MAEFDKEYAFQLLRAFDGDLNDRDAARVFEAVNAYLRKHGKKFSDLLGSTGSGAVVDLKLQKRVTDLERENSNLGIELDRNVKDLKKERDKSRILSMELAGVKLKKYTAAILVSAFTGAASVGAVWLIYGGAVYTSIKSGLSDHFDKEEKIMKGNLQEAVTSYNTKEAGLNKKYQKRSEELETKYQAMSRKVKSEAVDETESAIRSARARYDYELRRAKESFDRTLKETQPFRVGVGQYAYVGSKYGSDPFEDVYENGPKKGYSQNSRVVAKLDRDSCIIVTGVYPEDGDWVSVEQLVQGQHISGYMDVSRLRMGEVGPKVNCTVGRAVLAP